MELRHLRRFVTFAEELHFTRAAERVRIAQSPFSKTIKQLEDELGIPLFDRTRRNLTQAGQAFHKDVRGVLQWLDCAIEGAKTIASHGGVLRIAISDGAALPRLPFLLTRCREQVPMMKPLFIQVPLIEQLRGLRNHTFDAGFARSDDAGKDIEVSSLWHEPLVVAIPSRHPLLAHQLIPLEELLRYPLVMYHPEVCAGYCKQIERILRSANQKPEVVDRVTTLDMLLTLVAAGYGTGLVAAEQVALTHYPDIILRPLAQQDATLTTYLLRNKNGEVSGSLERFIGLARGTVEDTD
jgi:DNA-binding transcriptional LysR family regulator